MSTVEKIAELLPARRFSALFTFLPKSNIAASASMSCPIEPKAPKPRFAAVILAEKVSVDPETIYDGLDMLTGVISFTA